jgi:hypothetical protein
MKLTTIAFGFGLSAVRHFRILHKLAVLTAPRAGPRH